MKSFIYKRQNIIVALIITISFAITQTAFADNTTITNSVRVTSDSSGGTQSNQASVSTVVNGKTVESWSASSTDDISYTKTINTPSDNNSTTLITTTTKADREALLALIRRLQTLISLYVKLNQLN